MRTSFVLGAAFGYVLGAKAGRERYEQIKKVAQDCAEHPTVRSFVVGAREKAGEMGGKAAHKSGEMAGAARQRVTERRHREHDEELMTM